MPSTRTSPIIHSTALYSHTTPNLNQSRAFSPSSPADDFMATPKDYEEPVRGSMIGIKGRKDSSRRSVRVRDSSEGQHSSPTIKSELSSSLESAALEYPQENYHRSTSSSSSGRPTGKPRTRPSLPSRNSIATSASSSTLALAQAHGITADQFEEAKQQVMRFLAADPNPGTLPSSSSSSEDRSSKSKIVKANSRASSSNPPIYNNSRLSAPNVNGSTINTGLKTSSSPAALNTHSLPIHQSSISPVISQSHSTPSTASIPQSETFGSVAESVAESSANTSVQADGRSIRPKASLEEIVERTGERKRREEEIRKDREMRLWAEQGQDESSSEEESDAARHVNNMVGLNGYSSSGGGQNSTPRTMNKSTPFPRSSSIASPLLPSPSFSALISPAHQQHHHSSSIPSSLAKKGMMERFMSDRPAAKEDDEEEDSHLSSSRHSHHPLLSSHHSQHSLGEPIHDLELENYRGAPTPTQSSTHLARMNQSSPPVRRPAFSPDAMMTSPVPSRNRTGLMFSPDVARLLKSELDELEASESSSRRNSPRKRHEVALEERFSSPYQRSASYRGSAYSNGLSPSKRPRDGDELDSVKRARWNHQGDGLHSPTPSTPSAISLRAPSFCDSSPAMSDKASSTGGGGGTGGGAGVGAGGNLGGPAPLRQPFFTNSTTHPVSAPDYLYHGMPSSSPDSSNHSQSDYGHRGHRTSPGPTTTPSFGTLLQQPRSQSLSTLSAHPSTSTSSSFNASSSTSNSSAMVTAATAVAASALAESKRPPPLKRAETLPILLGADAYAKPAWSYAALIGQAIFSTETRKISLAEIYTFIMASYPYYKKEDSGWQNSIRHNLSLNECFIKTMRGPSNPGKGCLWAISVGCEEQFADGGFAKKGAIGKPTTPLSVNGGSNRPAAPSSATSSSGRPEVKSNGKRSRAPSHPSSRGVSPVPSYHSNHDLEHDRSSQTARAFSPASGRGSSPPTPPPIGLSLPQQSQSLPTLPLTLTSVAPITSNGNGFNKARRGSDASMNSVDSLSSIEDDDEPVLPQRHHQPQQQRQQQQLLQKHSIPKPKVLQSAYVHRPSLPQTSPALSLSRNHRMDATRRALTSPVAPSPPSSVYERDGPYQSLSYSHPSHRALALLASPESNTARSNGLRAGLSLTTSSVASSSQSSLHSGLQSHFLPAPHIFPGNRTGAGGRIGGGGRSEHDEKESRGPQSVMSPSSMVHTRSPVSSMRGGPRVPISPTLGTNEKLVAVDPEKKRRSYIPSVNALSDASASETFRSPPRHLRSPNARPLQSVASLQAAMSTPGARVRPWGSPGRAGGIGISPGMGDSWGFGDPFGGQVEAELERFMDGETVQGSGGSNIGGMPRLYWPSPSAPGHSATNTHVAW